MPPDSSSQNWSDELAAWMKESPHSVPTPSADPTSRLFSAGEKCEKPLETRLQQLLEEAMRDQDLGGAGHHAELECQRSVPPKNCAGWTHKLGHFDNLLGNREVERCKNVHQLFYHLRHNHLEQWDLRNRVNDLLHCAPLYLLLRQNLKQRCWPPGGWCLPNVLPGVHRKVPGTSRLGEGIFRNAAV